MAKTHEQWRAGRIADLKRLVARYEARLARQPSNPMLLYWFGTRSAELSELLSEPGSAPAVSVMKSEAGRLRGVSRRHLRDEAAVKGRINLLKVIGTVQGRKGRREQLIADASKNLGINLQAAIQAERAAEELDAASAVTEAKLFGIKASKALARSLDIRKAALSAIPKNQRRRLARELYLIGQAHLANSEPKEAITYLKRALKAAGPKSRNNRTWAIHYDLFDAYRGVGNGKAAVRHARALRGMPRGRFRAFPSLKAALAKPKTVKKK